MVTNLINRNGNAAVNQFVITEPFGGITFQSYVTKICTIDRNKKEIAFNVNAGHFSKTTSKHLAIFLEDELGGTWNTKAVDKAISSGNWNGYKVVTW